MLEQILQSLLIIAAIGLILLVFYRILKVSSTLFLIGLIGGSVFIEIYGIYLFFTERYLYTEDLATNGVWSFTGFFIVLNLFLVLSFIMKWWKNRMV
ncbi:Uncharacterised protein [Streptococcus gallolyticus]|uniref:Uncharacterized protein n=1 Tax=Streptococcus gallolyticus TaxID=315405 RepID=A0AA94M3K5_9STRE|nr:DUF5966 family protein [Streptococcus gallolyticus]AQP42551.1 hypothetical protein BTR42_07885 [Streptococcus gallolyticus subsp. gallolyticus DSM 16831]SQG79856.1 Uncharacterised protein [Streptococcus gallolyticus]